MSKKKQDQKIWAGSLHIDPKELGKKQKKKKDTDDLFGESRKKANAKKTQIDIINEYFAEISTGKALAISKPALG